MMENNLIIFLAMGAYVLMCIAMEITERKRNK